MKVNLLNHRQKDTAAAQIGSKFETNESAIRPHDIVGMQGVGTVNSGKWLEACVARSR